MTDTVFQVEIAGKTVNIERCNGKFVRPPELLEVRGTGSALKPAHEPICLARKPLSESSIARNVLAHGAGGLNIDECRVQSPVGNDGRGTVSTGLGHSEVIHGGWKDNHYGPTEKHPESARHHARGRWPSNLLLSHVPASESSPGCERVGVGRVKGIRGGNSQAMNRGDTVYGNYGAQAPDGQTVGYADPEGYETVEQWECARDGEGNLLCPIALLDELSGVSKSGKRVVGGPPRKASKHIQQISEQPRTDAVMNYGDPGGASRFFQSFPPETLEPDTSPGFFYAAKSSKRERQAGLESIEPQPRKADAGIDRGPRYCVDCGLSVNGSNDHSGCSGEYKTSVSAPTANSHPTVKPISLMSYLVKLITPPGGVVLDPFAGSGSTGCAAVKEGFNFIGIEQSEEYADIAERRIAHWSQPEEERNGKPKADSLF